MRRNNLISDLAQAAEQFGARDPGRVASIMQQGAMHGRDWTELLTEIRRNIPELFFGNAKKAKRQATQIGNRQR
jgi:hypothetical protein